MSFCFVDHITTIEPGRRAQARFTVPTHLTRFPSSLVTEAVGQLAGWIAMAGTEFRTRPIAALAHKIDVSPPLMPGTVLELRVEIERHDRDAVVYSGAAALDQGTVMEMRRCLGPMLAMEEFDDPALVRAHFEALCAGEPAGHGVGSDEGWRLPCRYTDRKLGEYLSAELIVPAGASFFAHHFPRKPVLPATLLLEAQAGAAIELAREAAADHTVAASVTQVRELKMRSFVPPGVVLSVGAQVIAARGPTPEIAVYAKMGSKAVASARITVALAEPVRPRHRREG